MMLSDITKGYIAKFGVMILILTQDPKNRIGLEPSNAFIKKTKKSIFG